MKFLDNYLQYLQQHGYQADEAQLAAAKALQVCEDEWRVFSERKSNRLVRFFNKPEVPRGVYLWGGVGRGKSALMDQFYAHLPIKKKTRIHFHEFMRSVHKELVRLKGNADPLDAYAQLLASRYQLICFDEFHVSDIADAMILHRLLHGLRQNNVGLVMTSNFHPDTLYPDGLHRDQILPAIELVKASCRVLQVDTGVDYRLLHLADKTVKSYTQIPEGDAFAYLKQVFESKSGQDFEPSKAKAPIIIGGRPIKIIAQANRVIWCDFYELCETARSQNDYLELIERYDVFILGSLKQMNPTQYNAARRFTWLIDVLYDHHVNLFVNANVSEAELYPEGHMSNEFQRVVSRLIEMQSEQYLESHASKSVGL